MLKITFLMLFSLAQFSFLTQWVVSSSAYSHLTYAITDNLQQDDASSSQMHTELNSNKSSSEEVSSSWLPNKATHMPYILIIILLLIGYKLRLKNLQKRQKNIEKQSENRVKEVEHLLLEKEKLFANIAHEIRTPLTLHSSYLTKLINNQGLNAEQNKLLNLANENSKRLFQLVDNILNLVKVDEKYRARLEKKCLVVDDLLAKYMIAFEPLFESKNISFSSHLSSNAVIIANEQDVASLVENLLTNALKYTKQGGWVKLCSLVQDDQYQLVVENAHQGLTEKETQEVFERFERLEQSNQQEGFGLGLAIVKILCQQNKWHIACKSHQLSSNKDHSVSFLLTINDFSLLQEETTRTERQISQLNNVNIIAEVKESNGAFSSLQKQSILIVEDNDELRGFLLEIFSDDYSVLTAKDGVLGVEIAINEIPDLVISDVIMANLNGFKLVERLTQHDNTCHIPIILLTGKVDRENELKGLKLGAIDFIAKPFDAGELLFKVKNVLYKKQRTLDNTNPVDKQNIMYKSEREKNFIEKLNQLVEQNYADSHFAVEQLVEQIAMSERQLQRKLKATFNQTPADFIRYYRLQKAKGLLLEGKSISYVADLVGFNSPSYFSRSFKAAFNSSPSEYIQKKTEIKK